MYLQWEFHHLHPYHHHLHYRPYHHHRYHRHLQPLNQHHHPQKKILHDIVKLKNTEKFYHLKLSNHVMCRKTSDKTSRFHVFMIIINWIHFYHSLLCLISNASTLEEPKHTLWQFHKNIFDFLRNNKKLKRNEVLV